jgi:hypothetical protein
MYDITLSLAYADLCGLDVEMKRRVHIHAHIHDIALTLACADIYRLDVEKTGSHTCTHT